jgi:hypothetical protein
VVFAFEAFCPYCGNDNERFNERLFEAVARTTLTDVRDDCARDQEHTVEVIAVSELADRELRWCPICGTRLPTNPSN